MFAMPDDISPPTSYEVLVSVSTALEGLRSSVRQLETMPDKITALDVKIGALILYIEDERIRRQEETEHVHAMEIATQKANLATRERQSRTIWGILAALGTAAATALTYYFGVAK